MNNEELKAELQRHRERVSELERKLAEPEVWEPLPNARFGIRADGGITQGFTDEILRLFGATSNDLDHIKQRAKERIARERLHAWVCENGEEGHYVVQKGHTHEWHVAWFVDYTPGPVPMSLETAKLACDLLNSSQLRLEVPNDI